MHAMFGATAVQGTWLSLPDDMKQHIPAFVATGVTIGLLAFGIVGRLRDQSKDSQQIKVTIPENKQ